MNSVLFKTLTILLILGAHVSYGQQMLPGNKWLKSSADAAGMIQDSLLAFEKDIASGKYGYVDEMFVTRNGKEIYNKKWKHDYYTIYKDSANKKTSEGLNPGGPYNYFNAWWHPFYRGGELHSLQSVTKTITSMIIGIAVTRNEFPDISEKVLRFFDTTKIKNIDDRKRRMTVRHLLTMTTGFRWAENLPYNNPNNDCTIMESGFDWVEYAINRPMAVEPGLQFNYNSGASQILSYIFREATGIDIEEYAAKHLFGPLGITDFFWKRVPTGLADTEGGLYLKAEDLAKLFYLFMQEGKWNGQQIIDRQWVTSSVSPAIQIGPGTNYGYKWWLYGYSNDNTKFAWSGSGFGGQWPIIIPEYNIVVVFTGWNIIPGKPILGRRQIIQRIVNAVRKE